MSECRGACKVRSTLRIFSPRNSLATEFKFIGVVDADNNNSISRENYFTTSIGVVIVIVVVVCCCICCCSRGDSTTTTAVGCTTFVGKKVLEEKFTMENFPLSRSV